MSEIDIVIVNYMSAAHTLNCVKAAFDVAASDDVRAQIIVIDNGDEDDAFEKELLAFKDVILERNTANIGFGAACNQGAALGTADVILFLNPDATLLPFALSRCLEFLRKSGNETVGVVGPEITDEVGNLIPSCSRLPTRKDIFFRSIGLHVFFRKAGYPFLSLAAHAESGHVGQVMGAALFIRRSLFQSLGGFDRRFFLYYDDVDLSARVHAKNSSCYFLKDARITHIGRASSSRNPGVSLALHIHSRITYARIHFGRAFQIFIALSSILIELPLRLFQALGGGGVVGWRGILKAYRLLLTNALPSARSRTEKT